jgi:hypothetical protein
MSCIYCGGENAYGVCAMAPPDIHRHCHYDTPGRCSWCGSYQAVGTCAMSPSKVHTCFSGKQQKNEILESKTIIIEKEVHPKREYKKADYSQINNQNDPEQFEIEEEGKNDHPQNNDKIKQLQELLESKNKKIVELELTIKNLQQNTPLNLINLNKYLSVYDNWCESKFLEEFCSDLLKLCFDRFLGRINAEDIKNIDNMIESIFYTNINVSNKTLNYYLLKAVKLYNDSNFELFIQKNIIKRYL